MTTTMIITIITIIIKINKTFMTSLTVPLAVCPWSPVAMQIYSPESISFFADLEEYIKFVFVFVFLIVFVFVFVPWSEHPKTLTSVNQSVSVCGSIWGLCVDGP